MTIQDRFEAARPIPAGVKRNKIGSYSPETFADAIGVQLAISYSREFEAWNAAQNEWHAMADNPTETGWYVTWNESAECTVDSYFDTDKGWVGSTSNVDIKWLTHWRYQPQPPIAV